METTKRILLFSVFSFIFLNAAKSQTSVYHPFPDSAVVWREHFSGMLPLCGMTVCVTEEDFQYFSGDNIDIGGVIYKKLLKNGSGYNYQSGPPPPCSGTCSVNTFNSSNVYVGSFRQDTLNRKVYFMSTDETTETLLYDFNLNIGDTLPETYNNAPAFNYVSAIDSIQIGSNYHKRFWISSFIAGSQLNYTSLIEGIGCELGLLEPITPMFEQNTTLICVTIGAIPVYPDTATVCGIITTASTIHEKLNFSIAPNPFHSFSTVTLPSLSGTVYLKIYNSFGQLVRSQSIDQNPFYLFREDLENGIYFIQLNNKKDGVLSGTFIVD